MIFETSRNQGRGGKTEQQKEREDKAREKDGPTCIAKIRISPPTNDCKIHMSRIKNRALQRTDLHKEHVHASNQKLLITGCVFVVCEFVSLLRVWCGHVLCDGITIPEHRERWAGATEETGLPGCLATLSWIRVKQICRMQKQGE